MGMSRSFWTAITQSHPSHRELQQQGGLASPVSLQSANPSRYGQPVVLQVLLARCPPVLDRYSEPPTLGNRSFV